MSHDIVDSIIFHLNRSYYGEKFISEHLPTEIIPSDCISVSKLIFSKINRKVMKNIIISCSFVSLLWDDINKTIYITNLLLKYGYNKNTLDMVKLCDNYNCVIAYIVVPVSRHHLCDICLAPFYDKMKIKKNITIDWYNNHGLRFGKKNNDMLFNLGINASNTYKYYPRVDGLAHRCLV
jgi:hypothetical protein